MIVGDPWCAAGRGGVGVSLPVVADTSRVDTIVVMGVAGVGKSTVALGIVDATGWEFAEGDSFHPPENVAKMQSGIPLDDDDRWPWLRVLRDWIHAHEVAGQSSVVTCSALKRAYRDVLRDGNGSVRFCALEADTGELRERLEHRRDHYMPGSLLQSQLDTLEPLGEDEPGLGVQAGGAEPDVVRRALAALGLSAPDSDHSDRLLAAAWSTRAGCPGTSSSGTGYSA